MTNVRVRIAPSPTGEPHVGTAYIALFNYAFAKSQNGKFILRIEDTDQTRSHPLHEVKIMNALRWLGLNWDEGPDIGGEHGPYRQSERTETYQQYAEKLILKDKAYRCFCTPERLSKMRADQMKRGLPLRYDGKCRTMADNTIAKKLKDKVPYVVRLKVPKKGKCTFVDGLRGEVTWECKEIDDQVLLKSDSFPTYHLANVVDDHLMKITHVIRGEEWISSTPKHVLLYEFLGFDKPEFIHMPLLLNTDGTKLSKRKNPTSVMYYRDAGYISEAVVNFLSLMGYSRPDGEEKFSMDDLLKDFDIKRVSLGGSVFDLKKLDWLSGKYIRENYTLEELREKIKDWRLNDEFFDRLMPLMQQRMDTLGDFMPFCSFLWAREIYYDSVDLLPPKMPNSEDTIKVLQSVLYRIEEDPAWEPSLVESHIKYVAKVWGWKPRDLIRTLFVAISGKKAAPSLFQSMVMLGKDMTRVRIMKAMESLGGLSKKKMQALEKEWRERRTEYDKSLEDASSEEASA